MSQDCAKSVLRVPAPDSLKAAGIARIHVTDVKLRGEEPIRADQLSRYCHAVVWWWQQGR